jgi:hypothetical protein
LRKPITGTAPCWARAASGQDMEVTAALPRSVMTSRRLIAVSFAPSMLGDG